MAQITMRLLAGDDQERSFYLSREFSSDVARLDGLVAHTSEAAPLEPGKRGDPVTLGAIAVTAVSSGALSALATTIGSYLARDKRTELEISRPDGLKIKVSSARSNLAELQETIRRLLLAMTGE